MEYKMKICDHLIFEIKSVLGRIFFNRMPKLKKNDNYLNFGCGDNVIDGFVNADFFRCRFWRNVKGQAIWQLDFRHPLNCPDNFFDGIYSEHTLEHLYPDDAHKVLKELYRVAKTGAYIRVTVPDLEKYVQYYRCEYDMIDVSEFKKRFSSGCSAIRNMTQNYFHLSAWNYEELKDALETAGFTDVQKMSYGDSRDVRLSVDLKDRQWETLYVEAKR